MGGNRRAVSVVLDEALRARLTSLAGSTRGQVRAVLRAKIVLAAAAGASNAAIARTLGVSVNTVRKWRGRFTAAGMEGLKDAPRPGRPRLYDSRVRLAVVASATSARPTRSRHGRTGPSPPWSRCPPATQRGQPAQQFDRPTAPCVLSYARAGRAGRGAGQGQACRQERSLSAMPYESSRI